MTDQTPLHPGHPVDRLTPEAARDILKRIEDEHRASLDASSRINAAWSSAEAADVRQVIQHDGNVDWREFVSHCGGILNVVALVDEQGQPDTGRIIPLVDELFGKTATTQYGNPKAGGMVMTRRPRNRPYRGPFRRVEAQGSSDGGDPPQEMAERMLADNLHQPKPKLRPR